MIKTSSAALTPVARVKSLPTTALTASVIIVTYNACSRIVRCLDAVLESTLQPLQVIVIDNGSSDDTVQTIRARFGDRVLCLGLDRNIGPAAARNRGVRHARGRYLAFLDNDTVPEPDWLVAPIQRMEKDRTVGACQCKLMLLDRPDHFDYVGDYLSPLGFLIQRAAAGELDQGQYDSPVEIFSAKSAGMVMRKSAFHEGGGFDNDYFIYVEETDLAWRVWLQGYRIVFEPESVVLHEFGTSAVILGSRQNVLLKYHGTRNYLTTLCKNAGTRGAITMTFLNGGAWLGIALFLLCKGCGRDAFHVIRGITAFLVTLPTTLAKRKRIQESRRIDDAALFERILQRRSWRYFYQKLAVPHKVGNAQSFYRPRNQKLEQSVS